MKLGDEKVIDHSDAVSLFGGVICTAVYNPSVISGAKERAEELTVSDAPTAAKNDFEAIAELFVQTLAKNMDGENPITVGMFVDRVGCLLNHDRVSKVLDDPKSVRTLDNIPISVN